MPDRRCAGRAASAARRAAGRRRRCRRAAGAGLRRHPGRRTGPRRSPARRPAAGPRPGRAPGPGRQRRRDIVRGFLRAQPGLDDDAAVARSYLTGDAASSWATRPRVVVYPDESTLHIVPGAGGAVHRDHGGRTPPSTRTGSTRPPAPGAKATLKLKLVQIGGQWRISHLDDEQARWLTSFDLDRVYAQVPLYYGVPGSRVLVPDMRWFAADLRPGHCRGPGSARASRRATCAAAVTTGIPPDTSLAVGSVPTAGTLASIDLTLSARQPGSSDRTLLWAQLAAAVAQTPGVVTRSGSWPTASCWSSPASRWPRGTTAGALGYSIDASPSSSADRAVHDQHGRRT